MKILLVHADKVPWATTHRAEALKKEWKDDEIEIAYFRNLPDGDNFDVIHFLYSGGISRAKDYILRYKDKTFTTLASQRTLDLYFDNKASLIEIFQSTVCCVCHNPMLAKKLRSLIKKNNVIYIPNGVDVKLFNRPFIVGFVGAKADNKDHKGFNLVKKACEELGLELRQAYNGSLSDVKPHKAMPKFYKKVDCLVIPSLSEGCNNPTLEALAMNKPVISTKVGIANELEGVIIIDRDVKSIKNALRHLVENPNPREIFLENYCKEIS